MEGFISADSHIVEPGNLWVERVDQRFRERAPRIESRADADYMIAEGLPPMSGADLAGGMANDKVEGRPLDRSRNRYANVRAGATDPALRLADQDLDSIQAEVIYPNSALLLMAVPDAELKRECLRVYNDWLAEFCSYAPKRLFGVGVLPVGGPVEWAIEEAHRVARLGLVSVMLPSGQIKKPYGDPYYDKLWDALADLGLPVALHVGATEQPMEDKSGTLISWMVDFKLANHVRTLANLVSSAIPERYPKLNFVMAEGGIGWVAVVARLMDHIWEDHHGWIQPKLKEPPSSYCQRQVYFTFEDDRPGLLTRELLNIEHLMWGSDYPHTEGTFPSSRKTIEHDFGGIPPQDARLITGGNAARLYGIAS